MSDEQRPTPGATAARRARRIGGRPTPQPTRSEAADLGMNSPDTAVSSDVAAFEVDDRPNVATGSDHPRAVRGLPLAWFPAAVLGTAAVLLLGLLIWFSHGGYWGKPAAKAVSTPSTTTQQQILAAAKTCFARLNSYDYRKLDEALAAGLKCTTGSFTSDYTAVFHQQIEKYGPTVKAVQSAQVNKAGIASISPDGSQWVVLIFGQLQTTNTSTEKAGSPRVSPVGGVVTMQDVNGRWLVSKVDSDAGNGLGG